MSEVDKNHKEKYRKLFLISRYVFCSSLDLLFFFSRLEQLKEGNSEGANDLLEIFKQNVDSTIEKEDLLEFYDAVNGRGGKKE